ncbi:MAG: aspartate kinase [Christensenellaceae bacterium]|jgi:aspartate kinase|nr:aspartate kinase [Christensenellaceae bacterium]
MIVCKFGGTSMATAESITKVKNIIQSNPDRKIIVVSAPGKRFKSDSKITDLLYSAYNESLKSDVGANSLSEVKERFESLAKELSLNIDINKYIDEIKTGLLNASTADYAASRGEYLSARIMAAVLGFKFIDAGDIIKFRYDGSYDADTTKDLVSKLKNSKTGIVIPGFYGRMPDKSIKTFTRGGSDVTGAIIAGGVSAELYENWTDVSGFMAADPTIVENPKWIDSLSYAELRELSYMGANVLHPDSIFPLREIGVPINIKNTFAPEVRGTMILKSVANDQRPIITGIAGKKGNTIIALSKSMMNSELGFGRKVLSVLERNGVSFEHIPTGIDTMSIIVSGKLPDNTRDKLVDDIKGNVNPDTIEITDSISLIAIVGHGMANRKGTAAKICTALYSADINIRMIDQGSSEMNVIVGVEDADYTNAIRALYKAFFN